MNTQSVLLNVSKNASTASLSAADRDFMPKPTIEIDSKVSGSGLSFYNPSSIQQMVHDMEEHYKKYYVKPESLPYRKNMARQFPKTEEESSEQRTRKSVQAETSRVSRDKNKFMRMRLEEDNEVLQTMLRDHIVRLVNLECYANELLVKNGQQPVEWQSAWEDDAYIDKTESTVCDKSDKGDKGAMGAGNGSNAGNSSNAGNGSNTDHDSKQAKHADHGSNATTDVDVDVVGDDQCMIDSDEADSDNENLTIYENYGEGTISGEEE